MSSGPPSAPRPPLLPIEPPPKHLSPHAVPWQHAFAWFETGLRLFKRHPGVWIALAFLALATELGLQLLPDPWTLLGKVLAPMVACGMLIAAAAADSANKLRVQFAFDAFRLPAGGVLAIVLSSLVTFGAEVFAAWWIADVNLIYAHAAGDELTGSAVFGVYTIGVLASLPVTFVPLHVLFEPVSFGEAFAASWNAFLLNTPPLLVYAAVSLVLVGVGIVTMYLGLLLVLPIWAASSYAAWKDVFGVRDAPNVG